MNHPHAHSTKSEFLSFAEAAAGLAMVVLVITGICGTLYKLVAPDGWIAQAFGRSLGAGATTVGTLVVLAACVWLTRGSARGRHFVSDLVVYGFAAAGALYLGRYLMGGGF